MHRYRRLALVVLFLLLLWATFRLTGLQSHFTLAFLQEQFAHHMVTGLLVFTALFALGNLIQIPGWIFLVAAVLAMGQFWGGVATYVAACITCASTFVLIRALGGQALRAVPGQLSARLFAQLDAHPVRSVALLRLVFQTVPALNYALALSGIGLRPYLVGTALGLPVPILLYSLFFSTLAGWLHWPLPAGT
jgi:uncharacterized membrane protein YdjX (TVP38/TMEM64 family)